MNPTEKRVGSSKAESTARRNRMLMYGFVISIIGFPTGILLKLPVVWGLAIFGIIIGGTKIVLRRSSK